MAGKINTNSNAIVGIVVGAGNAKCLMLSVKSGLNYFKYI